MSRHHKGQAQQDYTHPCLRCILHCRAGARHRSDTHALHHHWAPRSAQSTEGSRLYLHHTPWRRQAACHNLRGAGTKSRSPRTCRAPCKTVHLHTPSLRCNRSCTHHRRHNTGPIHSLHQAYSVSPRPGAHLPWSIPGRASAWQARATHRARVEGTERRGASWGPLWIGAGSTHRHTTCARLNHITCVLSENCPQISSLLARNSGAAHPATIRVVAPSNLIGGVISDA